MLRRPRSRRSGCSSIRDRGLHRRRPIDADDVGAEIGEQHRGERAGTDAGDLDDSISVEGACHPVHARRRRVDRLPSSAFFVVRNRR